MRAGHRPWVSGVLWGAQRVVAVADAAIAAGLAVGIGQRLHLPVGPESIQVDAGQSRSPHRAGLCHAVVAGMAARGGEGHAIEGTRAAAEPEIVDRRGSQHVLKCRARNWPTRSSVSGQGFGVTITSAPPSMSARAASGNSRSKQIITPTRTGPPRVSRLATGNVSPGVSHRSNAQSQVWTFA